MFLFVRSTRDLLTNDLVQVTTLLTLIARWFADFTRRSLMQSIDCSDQTAVMISSFLHSIENSLLVNLLAIIVPWHVDKISICDVLL